MNRTPLGRILVFCGVFAIFYFFPDAVLAYEFEARTQALTSSLITTVLPLLSTLGLVYAAILALSGDGAAKARIITVVVCSMVGFLAPHFINWLKAASGQ